VFHETKIMTDSWDERRKGQEDFYFEKANKDALARLARRKDQPARLSPATGSPMQQLALLGVVVDVCSDSGGVWLDAGELEQLTQAADGSPATLQNFIGALPKKTSAVTAKDVFLSPVSGNPLVTQTIGDVTVGFCQESRGIWIDGGQLERLVTSAHQSLGSSLKSFILEVLGKK
jgi:Zn-finger nucleic acid-binding protein